MLSIEVKNPFKEEPPKIDKPENNVIYPIETPQFDRMKEG
mgnify:CR=1 FL=1